MIGDFSVCPAPNVARSRYAAPDRTVDVHTHVFGPFGRFMPSRPAVYALPEASPDVHAKFRMTLGLSNAVIVQPGPYGADPSLLLEAIATSSGALAGIAVADQQTDIGLFESWASGGIKGLRFVEMQAPSGHRIPGSVGFDAIFGLAPAMRAAGLHIELWGTSAQLAEALPTILKLEIPVILDHMAVPNVAHGVKSPDFQKILSLLENPLLWAKLTVCRLVAQVGNSDSVRPFHDALIAAAPDRCLWGSDWPYVRLNPSPDAGAMLDLFADWTTEPNLRQAVLVDNPRRLYGFGPK